MAKPASITTGRIVAQYVVGVVDGADADDEPDFIPAQGSVTFETTVGYIPFPVVSGPNPITVLKTRITGILDDEGYLCTPDPGDKTKPGARGLRLVSTDNEVASVQGWTWIATPRFVDVNGSRLDNAIPPFPFHLPAQGPTDPPLDLATVVKVPASVGIGTVQAVALAASAQAAAVSASDSAEVAVATALELQRRADEGEFKGEPGPAGPNTVPTQEAVAEYATTTGNPVNVAVKTAAAVAVAPYIGTTPIASTGDTYPRFTPHGSNILTHSATGLPSIYWPWVIQVDDKIDNPLGKFYMYYSTDHDLGAGGIGMAYADHPLGPWTVKADHRYTDTVEGDQTETPSVLWNEQTKLFHMYYQQEGTGLLQSTALATSPDGLTWTRVGLVITGIPNTPGDGQYTYFKPFRMGTMWLGYHLMGGGDYAHGGISYSQDGINWKTDPRRFGYFTETFGDNTQRLNLSTAIPFRWRGQVWGVMKQGFHQSGFIAGGDLSWKVVRLTEDMRGIVGSPQTVYETLPAGETSLVVPTGSVEFEGKIYFYYRANGAYGVIRAAVVEA